MRSFSASLTARSFFQFRAAIVVAALVLVVALPLFERSGNGQQLSVAELPTPVNNQSSTVVIQTPEQVLTRPLRSIANVVRGEQSIRTQNGIGYRVVNVRAQDEIWLVSARQQKQCVLSFERLVDGRWVTASMAELTEAHAVDQQKSSLVYVHGNRTDDRYARSRGLQFYENVFNNQSCSGPVRFVIFAWRSERERIRPSSDFNVKLQRSVEIGPAFAGFLNRFHDRKMVLTGFSLGGQVVLSGLAHLQAQDQTEHYQTGKFQVAIVTPALKADDALTSVAPLPQNPLVTRTVVFVNQKDNAIRAAKLIMKTKAEMPAVTLEQIASQPTCGMVNPVSIEDITAETTGCHSIVKYSSRSSRLKTVLNEMVDQIRSDCQPSCIEPLDGIEVIERKKTGLKFLPVQP